MIELRDISDRAEDLLILERFYREIFESEFPDANERESLANMKEYLRLRSQGWYGENNYHLLIALDNGRPCGGVIADFLAKPKAGVIEFLVAAQRSRGSGLGRLLLDQIELILGRDAQAAGGELTCVVAEMNDPFKPGSQDDCFYPFVRATIWEKWGYGRLDFPYLQPALSSSQRPVSHLMLVAKALKPAWRAVLPSAAVKDMLGEYMRWAMRIERPQDVPEYRQSAAFIEKTPSVALVQLGAYVGRDPNLPVSIKEIRDGADPGLERVLAVYRDAFPGGPSDLDPEGLRQALAQPNSAQACYHLWALLAAADGPTEGVASFFTFHGAGFGGYVALTGALKGTGRFPLVLARIEEQMLRDRMAACGWYIECTAEREALFKKMGFHTIDIEYRQPPLDGNADVGASPILRLMYKDFGRQFAPPALAAAEFIAAVRQIFEHVYRIAAADTSAFERHIQNQIAHWMDGAVRFR